MNYSEQFDKLENELMALRKEFDVITGQTELGLREEREQLLHELAVTPPTITITVACGTDEEGNTIEESREVRNPEYDALLDEIDTVETKIQELKSLHERSIQKFNELGEEREQLMHELAGTPPTITIAVECGTDEEENTIYMTSEERNPVYAELQNHLEVLEAKIQELKSLVQ